MADGHESAWEAAKAAVVSGRWEEAEGLCRRALEAGELGAGGMLLFSAVLERRGKFEEALAAGKRGIGLAPFEARGYAAVGGLLLRRAEALAARAAEAGSREHLEVMLEASRHLEEAVRRDAQDAGNCVLLARAYERLELNDKAYHVHTHAVALRPRDVEIVLSMAYLLTRLGWLEEAEGYYRRALGLEPGHRAARVQLAAVLMGRGKYAEAVEVARGVVAAFPGEVEGRSALAEGLARVGKFEEALGVMEAVAETSAVRWQTLSTVHLRRGDLEGALAAIDRAMALDGGNVFLPFNKGIVLATMGRLGEAWPLLEWRWRNPVAFGRTRRVAVPRWRGEPLEGKKIALLAEQGLGDTVQFVRYARLVRERGGLPVVWCPAALAGLIKTVPGVVEVVEEGANLDALVKEMGVEAWLPLMSLPGVFGTTVGTVPAEVPYVSAEAGKVAAWGEQLKGFAGGKLKVGLVWSGGGAHPENGLRSMALGAFGPLGAVAGVAFFGLQKGPAEGEAAPAGMKVVNLGPEIGDFGDTAAILMNLDLLISVDTSVVHVAGALGRPVWTLLAFAPGHMWMREREDSPWYPTMRLFRQRAFGDWGEVVERVRGALEGVVRDKVAR